LQNRWQVNKNTLKSVYSAASASKNLESGEIQTPFLEDMKISDPIIMIDIAAMILIVVGEYT
jgi:hypothetical protein